jgi:hypothetical protein
VNFKVSIIKLSLSINYETSCDKLYDLNIIKYYLKNKVQLFVVFILPKLNKYHVFLYLPHGVVAVSYILPFYTTIARSMIGKPEVQWILRSVKLNKTRVAIKKIYR